MPTEKPQAKYTCSQAELYAVCTLGWNSCESNLADFTAHKTFYDAAYITARKGEVAAAMLLPDNQARGEAAEVFGIQLRGAADTAQEKWNALRSYIEDAFAPEIVNPKLEAAGYLYYPTASNGDWEDMKAMLLAGKTFITNNTAALTTPGGMPAAFAAGYNTTMDSFNLLYENFKGADQTSEEGTVEKINANNAIFNKLMRMFSDGVLIYSKNAAKRERFIFTQVLALVTPPPGGENVLDTKEGLVGAGLRVNLGALPVGTTKVRMKVVAGGPLEYGLSSDGLNFNGNTVALGANGETMAFVADFNSTGTTFVVFNQNGGAAGEYKVEFIA